MNDLVPRAEIPPPAEIVHPKQAEIGMRHDLAVLDVMKRGKAALVDQVKVLRRVIEYAVQGANLIDVMRERKELVDNSGPRNSAEVRRNTKTLKDLELTANRVSEWKSLRDNGALGFIDAALAAKRETTFQKASINWLRQRLERIDREQTAEQADASEPAYDYEIRHGDLRTALDDLAGQVDVIITDPPYPEEYLDEYDALSEVAARLLKPDGLLVVMVGQTHLPEYLRRLSLHMTYRWCMAYLAFGVHTRIFGRSVATMWKPLLVFDHGADRHFLTQDVFRSDRAEKDLAGQIDGWGQSETGMADIVEHLSSPGQLVVDPFLGAGTTAVACHALGRRFVGCDVSADAVLAARKRLAR